MTYVRFRKFVKKHERTLVIAGSFLAVASLLVKEIVREDVKDFRDALAAAKTIFIINTGFVALHQQIGVSRGQKISLTVDSSHSDAEKAEEYRIVNSIESFSAEVDNMQGLLEALHPSQNDEQMLRSAKGMESFVESELEKAENLQDQNKKLVELSRLEEYANSLGRRAFGWQGTILIEADKEQRSREKIYQRVNSLTYGLLVLGAITGLLGKVLNVKALDKSE